MANYEVSATPLFYDVTCPKHRRRMKELKTGLIEQHLWYCKECEKPYELKPVALRAGTYDQDKIDEQVK